MNLPQFQSDDRTFQLLQSKWASILNHVLRNPVTNPGLLMDIPLVTGDNQINHLLGRIPQGWIIADITAASAIYRSAAFNSKTLTLNASAPCTVTLVVF